MGDAPKKSLGLLDATLLVAGSMIGSGIFIVSSIMMNDIGSPAWMLVLWILTGLITILAALSYGELAGMMPNAGGQYVYIQRAFGRLPSFLYGWTVFTVIQTGVIAAVAVEEHQFLETGGFDAAPEVPEHGDEGVPVQAECPGVADMLVALAVMHRSQSKDGKVLGELLESVPEQEVVDERVSGQR